MKIKIKDILFRAGILFIAWTAAAMMLTNVLFCAGITVHLITLVLSFVLALFIIGKVLGWNTWQMVLSSVVVIILFFIMTFMSSVLFDISYDSNTLYKTAIGLAANNWNPMKTNAQDAINSYFGIHESFDTAYIGKWIDNYANGTWLFETYQYLITGKVNTGISFIWMCMCAVLAISVKYFKKMGLTAVKSFFAAVFLVFNPITMAQISTLYVDGPWMLMLSLALLMIVYIVQHRYDIDDKEPWVILFLAFITGSSMKLNAFAYNSVFLIAFYVFMLFDGRKNLSRSSWLWISCFCWLCAGFTIFGTGMSIYGKNILRYKNMFYGFFGAGSEDIIASNQIVPEFANIPSWKSFLMSMFAESSGSLHSDVILKIPFTVKYEEITSFLSPDVRVGGFGPWFSGILIISLIVIGIHQKKMSSRYRVLLFVYTILSLAMAFFLPGSYWLRYVSFIYFFVIIAYVQLAAEESRKSRVLLIIFGVMIAANTAMCSYGSVKKILNTLMYRDHIRQVSELPSRNVYVPYTQVGGLIDLEDYGISYSIVETAEEADFICPTYLSRPIN